jgi:hypothetical protein
MKNIIHLRDIEFSMEYYTAIVIVTGALLILSIIIKAIENHRK